MRTAFIAALLGSFAHVAAALGRPQMRYPVQPTTYASPSGACVLSIDPSDRFGAGPAELELRRADRTIIWSARYEHAVLDAVVADDSRAVGYALTKGILEYGEHVLVHFDAHGHARTIRQFPVRHLNGGAVVILGNQPQDPVDELQELAWNPTSDVVFARFLDASGASDPRMWRASGGTWLAPSANWEELLLARGTTGLGMRGLPGTPLFVHRRIATDLAHRSTLSTYLLDADLRPVWSAEVDDALLSEGFDRDQLVPRIVGDRLFDVPMPSALLARQELGELVRCEVRADASTRSGWRVDVVGTQPWGGPVRPHSNAGRPEARPIALEKIDDIALGDPSERAAAPIHDVVAWQVSASGEPEFIRSARDARFELVRLRADGAAAVEQRVPAHAAIEPSSRWHPLGPGRWIVAAHRERDEAPQACAYDAASNTLVELDYAGPAILGAAPGPDGGFYVLGEDPTTGSGELVRRCDARGRELWTRRKHVIEIADLVPPEPFVPCAIAPQADGGVLVLDDAGLSTGHVALVALRADGSLESRRELAIDASVGWMWELALSSDPAGNALVWDSHESPYFWLGADGSLQSTWAPAREHEWPYRGEVRFAADGTLWGLAGGCFWRFTRDGSIGRRSGALRAPGRVIEPRAAFVQRDRAYVQDASTSCIHGFEANGHALAAFAFEPSVREWFDFAARWECEPFGIGPGGRVVFGQGDGSTFASERDGRWIDESAQGPVVAWTSEGTPQWRVRAAGFERLAADGSVAARVERRADRRFFDGIGHRAARVDGTLAAIEWTNRWCADAVHVISPDGTVVRTTLLPPNPSALVPSALAFEGDWAVVTVGRRAWLYRLSADAWFAFEPPSADETSSWAFGIATNGAELWGIELDAMRLHRYRLPD